MHQWWQVSFRTSRRNVRFLFRRCSGTGHHLEVAWMPRDFSRVAAGFSCYNGELRIPLVLAQGSPISIRVVRESWGLRSSHCRANRPHLIMCLETNDPLQGRQGSLRCIPDSPGESGLVSSGSKELCSRLESQRVSLGAHLVA